MVQRISALSSRPRVRLAKHRPGLGGRVWAMLAELFERAEPIELFEQRFNFLPRSFRWRGDLRRVRAIVRVWELPGVGMRPARRYFEVLCGQGGSSLVNQIFSTSTWQSSHLLRAPGDLQF